MSSPKSTGKNQKKKKKKRKLLTTEDEASTGGSPSVASMTSASALPSPSRAQAAAQKGNKSLSAVEMALARLEARSLSSATRASGDGRSKQKSNPESALSAAAKKPQ